MYKIIYFWIYLSKISLSQIISPYETRPRLLIHDGSMLFHAGKNKNISFLTDGPGSVFFGNLDLKALPTMGTIALYQQQLSSLQTSSNSVRDTVNRIIIALGAQKAATNSLKSQILNLKSNGKLKDDVRNIKKQLKKLSRSITDITNQLSKDYCSSSPCSNGGTCLSMVGKYSCLCLDQFTGPNCEIDVNECQRFQGPFTFCQNGGTCINTHGGFKCDCPPNFFGFRCTERNDSCTSISSHLLCGTHGMCVPKPEHQANEAAYRCLCEPGFNVTSNLQNPQCQDIDECSSSPCFPGAMCTNTEGGFRCSSCPAGFTGSGYQCWDVDECALNNGGCSTSPLVQCINSYGSFRCGSCPPGYAGDGVRCSRSLLCSSHPCHSLATCFEAPEALRGFRCSCPSGMSGDGVGANGCYFGMDNEIRCPSSQCNDHGLCTIRNGQNVCTCAAPYTGLRCENSEGACTSQPCLFGGTCVKVGMSDYQCRCAQSRYGRNCEMMEEGCNKNFDFDNGSFRYPVGIRYRSVELCLFTITGAVGKALNLTFTEFDLENSTRPSCPYDNVTLYDGADIKAPIMGVFCGCLKCPKGPDPYILSSTNKVVIRFMTDATVHAKGFELSWKTINTPCGARINRPDGTISSPNYPRMYPENLHCRWIFSTEPGRHYKIQIGSVKLRSQDANCTQDLLQIKDGERIDSPNLYERCVDGTGLPENGILYSSLPYLFVYFRSVEAQPNADSLITTGGFSITFSSELADKSCGGRLTARTGFIQSPNYGNGPYFSDLNCVWILDGTLGLEGGDEGGVNLIELVFLDFDVRGSPYGAPSRSGSRTVRSMFDRPFGRREPLWTSIRRTFYPSPYNNAQRARCIDDSVEIRDGKEQYSPIIDSFCGKELPNPVYSTGPAMWIKFSSNGVNNGRGFKALYSFKCGKVFRAQNGTIQSPKFPNAFGSDIKCEYIINAPETHAIMLNFTVCDLGNPRPFNCSENYIEITTPLKNAWHNRKFCYVPVGRPITTSGGAFRITFSSDGSQLNKGFQALFNVIDVGCGGSLSGRHGSFMSPKTGEEYLHNMFCRWYIEVPDNMVVRLTFSSFALEEHNNCQLDYVTIYESYVNENNTSGFLGRYCGEMRPPVIQTKGNTMVVIFGSDTSIAKGGFEAVYDAINTSQGCDRTFLDSTGYIENIGYPSVLTRNMECEYMIHMSRGYKVLLTVENLTMPCAQGSIEIRNGPSPMSPVIGGLKNSRLCSDSLTDGIRSQGNTLYLKFKSRIKIAGTSFLYRLKYEQISESCGGQLNAITGALSAPQYPYSSSWPFDCKWTITVAKGSFVSLQIGSYDGETQPLMPNIDCWPYGSRLEIRDGPYALSPLIRRVCRQETTVGSFKSSGNEMTVRYVHALSVPSTGFIGHYQTICDNVHLKSFSGRLESPGFPESASVDRSCRWTIETTIGNKLKLQFTHFDIGDLGYVPCSRTYLQLNANQIEAMTNWAMRNFTKVAKFCNSTSPKPYLVYSSSNKIDVEFKATAGVPGSHFAIEWTTIGCGGLMTQNNSRLRLTNDSMQSRDIQCDWVIKAPIGWQIQLTINQLTMNSYNPSSYCEYRLPTVDSSKSGRSGVHIFNGPNNSTGHPILSVCDTVRESNTVVAWSSGNEMFVSLIYLHNMLNHALDLGFSANYVFVESQGCGGLFTAETGFISSPNYPNPYSSDSECIWTIKVVAGYIVRLKLASLDFGVLQNGNCESMEHPALVSPSRLSIFDGENTTTPLLAQFCGNSLPENPIIMSSSNTMTLKFFSSSKDLSTGRGGRGFSATYETGCGGTLKATASPRSLESLKGRLLSECTWHLIAENSGDKVFVSVNYLSLFNFDLQNENDNNCSAHSLSIYDGPEDSPTTLLDTLCGSRSPPTFVSTGPVLTIKAKLLDTFWISQRDFSLTYSSSSSFCGGDYYSAEGAFNSPGYPQPYPDSTVCIWTINSSPGNRIVLIFDMFSLSSSEYCAEDYVEIREGDYSGKLLGRFCQNVPARIVGYDKLWIKFRTDDAIDRSDSKKAGFRARYVLVFGGDFTASSGIITSPWFDENQNYLSRSSRGFPLFLNSLTAFNESESGTSDSTYSRFSSALLKRTGPNNEGIWWRIMLPDADSYVQVQFDKFYAERNLALMLEEDCGSSQKVELYDGYCHYQTSDLRCTRSQVLCGSNLPEIWTSLWNVVSIRMTYNVLYPPPAFRLQWSSVSSPRTNETLPSDSCGGTVTAGIAVRTLQSPGYPNGYADGLRCTWDLEKSLRNFSVWINLTDIDLETHHSCMHDYLQVGQFASLSVLRNAFIDDEYRSMVLPNLNTQSLSNRFCGSKLPDKPYMDFKRNLPVKVIFKTDYSINGTGFSMQYGLKCGSSFDLKNGDWETLTSPNFPSPYPTSTNCVWIIRAMKGRTLEVEIESMQLELSPGCTKDYIKIINGQDSNDPVLGKFCGSNTAGNLSSTSHYLYIEFNSDDSLVSTGFSLRVSEKKFGCDEGTLTLSESHPEGVLTSPSFPQPHGNSLDCAWIIQAPPGFRIQFDFDRENFDLETSRNSSCVFDYVELRDGASLFAPLIGRYCSKNLPGSLFSTDSFMLVRFVSDESIAKRGFRSFYKIAKCGGTILLQTGIPTLLSSPNYPHHYPSHSRCEWTVSAPEGHFITFSFADLDLLGFLAVDCADDYVEIIDGNSTGVSFGRFCRAHRAAMLTRRSSAESIFVKFVSDAQTNLNGFKLRLNASEEACGGTLTESSGIITSPSYPSPYPNRRKCIWRISAPVGSGIRLSFVDLHLPENEMKNCRYDSIKIYDGPDDSATLMDTYCGTKVPSNSIHSSSDTITIIFSSDVTNNGRGFKISYIVLDQLGCGGLLDGTSDMALSMLNMSRTYCHWKITRPSSPELSISVQLVNFNVTKSPSCSSSRIYIYGQLFNDEPHSASTLCGFVGNKTLAFYHPVVHIHLFLSNATMAMMSQGPNSIEFKVLFKRCGGILSSQSGSIKSPGFPSKYEDHLDCPWLIIAPPGQLIRVTLRQMNIEANQNCNYDRLTLKAGPYWSSPNLRQLCGDMKSANNNVWITESSSMLVLFHTDHSRSLGGFWLDYDFVQQACGSMQHGDRGLIKSQGYPADYPNNQFCQWEVAVDDGFHVSLNFAAFDIQNSENCTKDYVQIENWRLAKSKVSLTWDPVTPPLCGINIPAPITSNTNHLRITFKSDESVRGSGFNLTWNATCGFTYTDLAGLITSPHFPNTYQSSMSCEYYVRPRSINSMFYTIFQFNVFELEPMTVGICHDYVEIIEIASRKSMAKLCGSSTPDHLSLKGDAKIVFHSDSSNNYHGFSIGYKVSDCGGDIMVNEELRTRSAVIQTPTYPAKYLHNMNCEWIITTSPNRIIDFKFTNLSTEAHQECKYDGVEIRDGDSMNSTLIGKFCGSLLPINRFKSSGSKMFIRFFSDASVSTMLGFQGVASSTLGPSVGCGGVISVTESNPTVLKSPRMQRSTSSAFSYYRLLSCEWRILAPANRILLVEFQSFRLEQASRVGKCYDYLEIYDGFLETGPLVGKYCGSLSPSPFNSSGDQLYLHFFTDQSIELAGFEIKFTAKRAECGGTIVARDAPQNIDLVIRPEQSFSRCRWVIESDSSKFVEAQVRSISLDSSSTAPMRRCTTSYLEFATLPLIQGWPAVRECGKDGGFQFVSKSNKMYLSFVHVGPTVQRGSFSVQVQNFQDCNKTINLPALNYGARITSPYYPNKYKMSSVCTTTINADLDHVIQLYFVNFTLEESVIAGKQCQYDNLTISESNVKKTVLCGRSLPPVYKSQTNSLQITFKSDASLAMDGFDISVITTESDSCGGNLSSEIGAIASPNHPDVYPPNSQCTWTLRVARGFRVAFGFTALEFNKLSASSDASDDDDYDEEDEPTRTSPSAVYQPGLANRNQPNHPKRLQRCSSSTDRLEIYYLSSDGYSITERFCYSSGFSRDSLPPPKIVDDNIITVKFISYAVEGERASGFRLIYQQIP